LRKLDEQDVIERMPRVAACVPPTHRRAVTGDHRHEINCAGIVRLRRAPIAGPAAGEGDLCARRQCEIDLDRNIEARERAGDEDGLAFVVNAHRARGQRDVGRHRSSMR
jgi:hypothetical protein